MAVGGGGCVLAVEGGGWCWPVCVGAGGRLCVSVLSLSSGNALPCLIFLLLARIGLGSPDRSSTIAYSTRRASFMVRVVQHVYV